MGGRRRKPGKIRLRRDYAGRVAYTALYLPGPDEDYLSAGTFDAYEEAETAWIAQAESLRRGVHVDPRKGRALFRDFALLWGELFVSDRANTTKGCWPRCPGRCRSCWSGSTCTPGCAGARSPNCAAAT
jgi:hypothetical protein